MSCRSRRSSRMMSYPNPRPIFDDTGGLYALHADNTDPYVETLTLSPTGVSTTSTWFDAVSAIWFPFEVSVKGSEVYFAQGDVANIANQTVERRFDYNDVPFVEVNAPELYMPTRYATTSGSLRNRTMTAPALSASAIWTGH